MATTAVTKRNIKVNVQGVNLGKRALCATVQFDLSEKKPDKDVAEIWKKLMKRRLIGSLKFGGDDPDQTMINGTDRLEVRGSFDTHKPSFDEESATLKLTFDQDEVDEVDLIKFRFSEAWLCIDEIIDIPEKRKELEDWRDWPLGLVGLEGPMTERMKNIGIENVGGLVDLVNGDYPLHTIESLKIKGRVKKIADKINWLFEDKGVDSPLN